MSARVRRALVAAGVLAAVAVVYRRWIAPRHRTWGATPAEATESLPGDDLLPPSAPAVTHAITIDAPPSAVWPWLVQMGQGRAGFYTYDWLERLVGADIRNADRIVPAWQDLSAGDVVRLAPEDYAFGTPASYPTVAECDPERALVLLSATDPPSYSWAFVLRDRGDGTTRFVVRMRSHPAMGYGGRLAASLWDLAHFVMERGMLRGVKRRAEAERRV